MLNNKIPIWFVHDRKVIQGFVQSIHEVTNIALVSSAEYYCMISIHTDAICETELEAVDLCTREVEVYLRQLDISAKKLEKNLDPAELEKVLKRITEKLKEVSE